jgi:nucleoside-diphosphate-sugar epimerase
MGHNLLITGVSGFIGRYVAAEALRRGYRVTGLDRTPSSPAGVEFIPADIRDKDRMLDVMRGQDCVVHLAAITSNVEFIKNPIECYDINANGFLNVLDAAVKRGCAKVVYASSSAVYLDGFSEDTVIDFGRQTNHYAKAKLMNEMVAQSYEEIYRVKTTGLRFFNTYGDGENAKGDYASIISLFRTAKRQGEPLVVYGDGTQARDLINVRDVARISLDLLEKGSAPVYNIGTGVATQYLTIAKLIDPEHIVHVPNPLPSYQYLTRADTTRLRETIGDYRCVALERGIREMTA